MAKAGKDGWDNCFHGTIRREKDEDGNPIVYGNIKINEGYIIANAKDQWELGEKLDELVLINLTINLFDGLEVDDPKLNQMKDFELLKRTYPVSEFDRNCDGFEYIINNSTFEKRKEWGVNTLELQRIIKEGEKYIYQVAKERKEFKAMCLSFTNYAIIRKYIFGINDD